MAGGRALLRASQATATPLTRQGNHYCVGLGFARC